MLTARAEYRLRLRANNASTRLTPLAIDAGCVGPQRQTWFRAREQARASTEAALARHATAGEIGLASADGGRRTLFEWLGLPGATAAHLLGDAAPNDPDLAEELEEDARYAPYVARQDAELRDVRASEGVAIPQDFAFERVPGLSCEMVERLHAARPATLGAAGRIPGITPAALAVLLVHTRQRTAA
jgi:tRNA uridine 5-carboxymethylaminomethyl modification enzyme